MRQNNENFPAGGQLDGLLKTVAEKMGKSPQALQQELQSGKLNNPEVQRLLNDKEGLQQFMKSPQVQRMLEELNKK